MGQNFRLWNPSMVYSVHLEEGHFEPQPWILDLSEVPSDLSRFLSSVCSRNWSSLCLSGTATSLFQFARGYGF